MRGWFGRVGLFGIVAALSACAGQTPAVVTASIPPQLDSPPHPGGKPVAAVKPSYPRAAALQTSAGGPLANRPGYATADFAPALAAFRASCPALLRRADASGLTQAGDWTGPCAAATVAADARAFFTSAFTPVVIADGRGLDTGYYEPNLAASPVRAPGYSVPLFRRPPDLIDLDLGTFDAALTGKHVRGRIAGGGFVPYYDRAAIDDGALGSRGLELAWAADPYAAFFLEIQGSGRLTLPDGTVQRVGYDGQNGHAYTGIGKLLRDRGALGPGQATMAGIIGWLHSHPVDARTLLRENRSKVFFKMLNTPPDRGPPGALGIPLTPRTSAAADPAFVPLGAPLWLDTLVAGAPFCTVVVAQDTGGAIKGANRLDLFWGSGDAAGAVAGGITASGSVTLLLPAAAAARLTATRAAAPPRP